MSLRFFARWLCVLGLAGNALAADWLSPSTQSPPWLREVQMEGRSLSPTLFRWNSDTEPQGGPPGRDEPLASDRPDFTEASCTVGQGVRQLEMGYTFTYDHDGATQTNSHSYPELLLRAGVLAEWLELRVGWSYNHETAENGGDRDTIEGGDDLYLGFKLGLTQQQGILPEMALMPQMTVPLGSPFSSEEVLPGINWLYGWEINDFLSAGGSTQGNMAIDDSGDKYFEMAQSLTLGYSLCEKVGAYTEWFVFVPSGAVVADTEHYVDGGLTYSFSNDLQFDVRVGKGISSGADDFFTGAGAVARW